MYFDKGMEVLGVDKEQTNPIIDINDPVCLELLKGRDKQEFDLLVSEINRLRVSLCQADPPGGGGQLEGRGAAAHQPNEPCWSEQGDPRHP